MSSRPTGGDKTHKLVSSPSGKKVSTNDSAFVPVPNLGMLAFVPDNGEIAVTFSGEVQADPGASLSLRLKVGSTVVAAESVVVATGGLEFESQSFAFDRKHVFTPEDDGGLYGITLEWSVTGGAAAMGDRTATLKSSALLALGITIFGTLLFSFLLKIPFALIRGVWQ